MDGDPRGTPADNDPTGDPADDPMGPPKEPCECWCMHCRRTFLSSEMWFQRVIGDPQGFKGFWKCPTPNCGGAGFTFDIFPTDPDHPANEGWYTDDDDDDGEYEDEEDDPELDVENLFDGDDADADGGPAWDPEEKKWKELDEELAELEDVDDLEGEEWKHGLSPGERPPEPDWMERARREQEEQERQYDEPDRRPRELDWSDRTDLTDRPQRGGFTDDDIPF